MYGCGGGTIEPTLTARNNIDAFYGDSIMFDWNIATFDTTKGNTNLSIQNSTTANLLNNYNKVLAFNGGVVILFAGIEDMIQLGPVGDNISSIQAMAIQATASKMKVILCSVLPTFLDTVSNKEVEDFNQRLITLAAANGYEYVDFYDEMINADGTPDSNLYQDAMIPNVAGYTKMWAVLSPIINNE
jgi:lysophospholipase L1-like esterase